MHQFVNQDGDAVNKRCNEHTLGCFITMGVNINRKENCVGKQGNTADRS